MSDLRVRTGKDYGLVHSSKSRAWLFLTTAKDFMGRRVSPKMPVRDLITYVEGIEPRDMNKLGHERRVNSSERQTCCRQCHTCGGQLREVLDGELWCDACKAYR